MLLYFKGLRKQIVVEDLLLISLYGVFTRDYFRPDLFLSLPSQFSPVYLSPASVDCSALEYVDILE
jgi:hypothetical protein